MTSSSSSARLRLQHRADLDVRPSNEKRFSGFTGFPRLAAHFAAFPQRMLFSVSATGDGRPGVLVGEPGKTVCASRTLPKPSSGTVTAHEVNAAGTRLYFLAADESDPQARYTDAAKYFLLSYELDFSDSDDKHGDIVKDAPIASTQLPKCKPYTVSISPDQTILAVACQEPSSILLYDAESLVMLRAINLVEAIKRRDPLEVTQQQQQRSPHASSLNVSGYAEWSRDGRRLCARVSRYSPSCGLVIVLNVPHALATQPPRGAQDDPCIMASFAVSNDTFCVFTPDGSRLVLTHPDPDRYLFQVVDCATQRVVMRVPVGLFGSDVAKMTPHMCLDDAGTHFLFAKTGGRDLFVVRLNLHAESNGDGSGCNDDGGGDADFVPIPVHTGACATLVDILVDSNVHGYPAMYSREHRLLWTHAERFRCYELL